MLWEHDYDPTDPQSGMAALVNAWQDDENKVFVLRTTGPVKDVRTLMEDNFRHLGRPVPLAEDVNKGDRDSQRSGELWFEVRYDSSHPDAYRHSANAQPLHTDGSYIPDFPNATLMACVANAGEGGETIFIDAEDLVTALQTENPELLADLRKNGMPHARSGDARTEKVIDSESGKTLVNWNYYCVDKNIDKSGKDLSERFFAYLQSSAMVRSHMTEIKLRPGDAVTWKDREVLHGRNGFKANVESERFLWKCAIDIGDIGD